MIDSEYSPGGETEAFRHQMKLHAESLRTFDGYIMHEVSLLTAFAHKLYIDGSYDISMLGSEQLRDNDTTLASPPQSEEEKRETQQHLATAAGKYILGNTLLSVHFALQTGTFDGISFRQRHNYGIAATQLTHIQIDDKNVSIVNRKLYPMQVRDLRGLAEADPTLSLVVEEGVFPREFDQWLEKTVVAQWEEEDDGQKVMVVKTAKGVMLDSLSSYKKQAKLLQNHPVASPTLETMHLRVMINDDQKVEKDIPGEVEEMEIFGPEDRKALQEFLASSAT